MLAVAAGWISAATCSGSASAATTSSAAIAAATLASCAAGGTGSTATRNRSRYRVAPIKVGLFLGFEIVVVIEVRPAFNENLLVGIFFLSVECWSDVRRGSVAAAPIATVRTTIPVAALTATALLRLRLGIR